MRYRNFIKSDIELIKENANFNDEQKQVFEMLISPAYGVTQNNVSIAMNMHISERKLYKIKHEIEDKISRIFAERVQNKHVFTCRMGSLTISMYHSL